MRRLLALLALVASATLALPTSAVAGGPTSVLITDPSSGEATALYYSDAAYGQLDQLLADGEPLDGEPAGLGTQALNLTWMVHDVSPWRTQQLFLDAEGGPVLATHDELGSGATTWSRPAEGKSVFVLAEQLLAAGGAPAPEVAVPDPVVAEKVVTETAWWSLGGWRWALPGLVLGAGLALLATVVARGRSREREPRQVLVDVAP